MGPPQALWQTEYKNAHQHITEFNFGVAVLSILNTPGTVTEPIRNCHPLILALWGLFGACSARSGASLLLLAPRHERSLRTHAKRDHRLHR
jgi:hypothetical protein